MEITPVNQQVTSQVIPPQAPIKSANVQQKSQVDAENVKITAVEKMTADNKATEKKRFDMMQRGSQQIMSDLFVVSDMRFTIFKDTQGQLVTRFTSLRDGSVRYYPEPEVQQYMENRRLERQSLIEIQA
jgi:hypothetical protein